jgi:hypothetical protein
MSAPLSLLRQMSYARMIVASGDAQYFGIHVRPPMLGSNALFCRCRARLHWRIRQWDGSSDSVCFSLYFPSSGHGDCRSKRFQQPASLRLSETQAAQTTGIHGDYSSTLEAQQTLTVGADEITAFLMSTIMGDWCPFDLECTAFAGIFNSDAIVFDITSPTVAQITANLSFSFMSLQVGNAFLALSGPGIDLFFSSFGYFGSSSFDQSILLSPGTYTVSEQANLGDGTLLGEFFSDSASATVDINLQEVPEPRMSLLILTAAPAVVLASRCARAR